MDRDRCRGCQYRAEYELGRTLCLRYGFDYPGFNWICPDALQTDQINTDPLSNRVKIFQINGAIMARYPQPIPCHYCGKRIFLNQLVVSRRTTSTALYHYRCAEDANII